MSGLGDLGITVATNNKSTLTADHLQHLAYRGLHTRFVALVVSSDPLHRRNLVRRLRGFGAKNVVEAGTHAQARECAQVEGPKDLVLVDGTAGESPILPIIGEIRDLGWRHAVILTGRSDAKAVRSALSANIRTFIVSPRTGINYQTRAQGNIPTQRANPRSTPDELSSREVEVIRAVAGGHSNKQIGEELGLSALTVKSHLARIARKLGTGDRAEMVAMAMRAGFVH